MDYTKEIDAIAKAGESVQLRVHKLLFKIATDWSASGDVRPAVVGVNYLLGKFPAGMRSNAIRSWVEVFFGFVGTEDKLFSAGAVKAKDLDLTAIKNNRWWEFTPEPVYQPITDFNKLVASLVKKGEADRKKLGDKSAVPAETLAKIAALLDA